MSGQRFFVDSTELEYDFSEHELKNSLTFEGSTAEVPSVTFLNVHFGGDVYIPSSVFSSDLAPLQAVVKYLKEERKMSNRDISNRLQRDIRTIWLTYAAVKKRTLKFEQTDDLLLPLSKICSDKLSILEAIVFYLFDKGMTYSGIAKILFRDPRTIWTVYMRAKKKIGIKNESG